MYPGKILVITLTIFFTVTGLVSGSERNDLILRTILESLTAVVSGPCHGEDGVKYVCVKCTKKGELGFFYVVLSEDDEKELVITHVVGKTHTVIWRKEEPILDFE